MNAGIITLISVVVNTVAAVFAPFIARKLASQQDKIRRTEETMNKLGAGLRVIESAVDENKDTLSRTGAGDRIVRTIRTYGPAARQIVDAARSAARTLQSDMPVVQKPDVSCAERDRHAGGNA